MIPTGPAPDGDPRRVCRTDDAYPRRLRDLPDPPDPLFVDGDASALSAVHAIAIVGTRRLSPYGERVARELATAAARAGAVVVSGLAQGIDTCAHEGALAAGGRTVAVLGEGFHSWRATCRGRRARVGQAMLERGALVTAYPHEMSPQRWTFAKRNAVIAALADVVVVVEAPEGSGALITAADARRLGRALFAVPGPLGVGTSAGTNALIASGAATLLLSSGALIEALGLRSATLIAAAPMDREILDALAAGPRDLDSLARSLGGPADVLNRRLATLVLSGVVSITPDGRYART